jgi:hypothetical protein
MSWVLLTVNPLELVAIVFLALLLAAYVLLVTIRVITAKVSALVTRVKGYFRD